MDCIRRNCIARNYAVDASVTDPYGDVMTTNTTINHAFFMHVRTTREWLKLPPRDRFAFLDEVIRPLLAKNPQVTMRYFDAEAFSAEVTDVLLWETADVMAYQAVVEDLRETMFWGGYFDVVAIVASVENGYAIHYGVDPA
jgi:hypothetical protein